MSEPVSTSNIAIANQPTNTATESKGEQNVVDTVIQDAGVKATVTEPKGDAAVDTPKPEEKILDRGAEPRGVKRSGDGGEGTVPQSDDARAQTADSRGGNTERKTNNSPQNLSRSARKKQKTDTTARQTDWASRDRRVKPDTAEGAEAEGEERRPKRKVAVYIGYTGTGYKGMQFNPPNPTIEGDLFDAFIKAGAVSKANSNDPKKSAFARCARTDKGVHAAGNLISLKMIIEDEDILEKINSHLPETIRVWGIQRTTGSFSCYQLCDSRKYEYLLPSHVFLPPHPSSFLGKQLKLWAEKEGKMAEWEEEQKDVSYFWDTVKAKVQPLLEGQDAETVAAALEAVVSDDEAEATGEPDQGLTRPKKKIDKELYKKIRAVHIAEKKAYRCSPERLERLRKMLEMYVGTKNFHNYTINKSFKDASAKRHIKSFVALDPIIVGDTEWIRTRVHGQSFMMHQIRKMIGMAMLVIRCGTDPSIIEESYTSKVMPIPKAPGIGLFLDRPVFDTYNKKAAMHGKDAINFDTFEDKIEAFKRDRIYKTLYEEEESANLYHTFCSFIDNFRDPTFLYLTAGRWKAVQEMRDLMKAQGLKTSEAPQILGKEGDEDNIEFD